MNHADSYSDLFSIPALHYAWARTEESDGCAGVDGITLSRFNDYLDVELNRLSEELITDTYEPLPVVRFLAEKRDGGHRPLCVLAVRDRVAQNAVIAHILPRFEAEFEVCSYAYRKGRSVQQALAQIEQLREAGFTWVVDADITAYFDNVDHGLLMSRVRELVGQPPVLKLIEKWIAPKVYDGHVITQMEKGLPQGAPISPMLANLYLDTFDEQMLHSHQKLVRFADDFLVLCKSRPRAEDALRLTKSLLSGLRLTLNDEKTRVTNFAEGFKYLGATFTRSLVLVPPPRRNVAALQADVLMPPPLPILRASSGRAARPSFNAGMREGMREAFDEISVREVPSYFAPDFRRQKSEAGGRKSEGGRQNAVGRGPESEVGSQRSDDAVVSPDNSVRELQRSSMFVEDSSQQEPTPSGVECVIEDAASPEKKLVVPPSGGSLLSEKKLVVPASGGSLLVNSEAVSYELPPEGGTTNDELPPEGVTTEPGTEAGTTNGMPPPALFTLRTLYLHEHGAVLRCEDDHLRVSKDDVELLSVPAFKLDQIMLFGNSLITTPAMRFCLRHDIPIVLLSGRGDFFGTIESTGNQNVLLHQQQFLRVADSQFVLETARQIVAGKIANSRALLQRRQRAGSDKQLANAIRALGDIGSSLLDAEIIDEVRGYEGAASAAYFAGLSACFQEGFTFTQRTRRPPLDPVNAMLSFGYTLLFYNIYAIVRARGLSPYVGTLHSLKQGHPALCSDLIEEFRAPIVDSLVTTLVNKRIVTPADFHSTQMEGKVRGCFLTDSARKVFVAQFEHRLNTLVRHPRAGLRTTWRGCIDIQVGHFIQVLRGDAERYWAIEIR
jgi:group II intron reverse transcriptase/maturase/CRISPR-associated endonuclease Cas1